MIADTLAGVSTNRVGHRREVARLESDVSILGPLRNVPFFMRFERVVNVLTSVRGNKNIPTSPIRTSSTRYEKIPY